MSNIPGRPGLYPMRFIAPALRCTPAEPSSSVSSSPPNPNPNPRPLKPESVSVKLPRFSGQESLCPWGRTTVLEEQGHRNDGRTI